MMEALSIVKDMVYRSERHADDTSKDRLRAVEYYQGVMRDTPSDDGRSKMVTRDVRAQIKKVLPSIMRNVFGSDEVVEFLPVAEDDEQGAEQATDYINYVMVPEANVRLAVHDAIHDALLLRNGILKWWHEEKQVASISRHTGLTEEAYTQLVADDAVEVVEKSEYPETIETPEGDIEVMLCDLKIRRVEAKKETRCAAVPRERFLIHPDAVTLQDSLLAGEKTTITRSELVAMGYDRDLVDTFAVAGTDDDEENDARRDVFTDRDEAQMANDEVDYYDIFVRVDMDDDGIAELRHMTFAGGISERNLLEDDEVDEVQMCDLCIMRQPHQWEGISLADDLMDLQRGKTVLFRQTLDNLYWQNNLQPVAQDNAVLNPEALANPEFGLPIMVRQGVDVRAALGHHQVPFVASDSYGMMEYMDKEATDRTGVSEASSGLAPDALQNMTAKASAMIEQAGIGQTEMMVRNIAEGLRVFFQGLLRLTIRHQDVPRTVRLRGKWAQVDPRHWNAEMDCTVNTGLGAGTRERDMQMMQMIVGLQEKILAGFGPDNPFVKPDNLYNAFSKLIESAGLKTPSLYLTEPDPQEVEQKLKAIRNKKPPEQMKMEMQMQLEQAKMQTNTAKEKAQMEADLHVKQAEIAAHSQAQAEKLQSDAALLERKLSFEQAKHQDDMNLRREEIAQQRQDAIWQAQAQAMTNEAKEAS